MKRLLATFLLILLGGNVLWIKETFAENDAWYFIVTAYYSPLPDQKHYYTGSYETEVILNWKWTHWASGKEVFSGMLAAPKSYEFGTKIYLEWLWIWEVADRWGAIVSAWVRNNTYDRIDIWVWEGDEWLARALYWWKRTIKWYTVHNSQPTSIDISWMPAPEWTNEILEEQNTVFDTSLWKGSDPVAVSKLQEFFKDIGLYDWEINWLYNNKIIDIVYNYQIEKEIIKAETDEWAWYWWKITRDHFKKDYLNWEFDPEITPIEIELPEERVEIPMVDIDLAIFEKFSSSNDEIVILQNILTDVWAYDWEITSNFNDIKEALIAFQIEKWVVETATSPWAWTYWPKTREALKTAYIIYIAESAIAYKARAEEEELAYQEKLKKEEEYKRAEELAWKIEELKKTAIEKATEEINPIKDVEYWESSDWVRQLQWILKTLWFFAWDTTGYFGDVTKEALMNFQADNGLIRSKDDIIAWRMSPETSEFLIDMLADEYLKDEIKKAELASIE